MNFGLYEQIINKALNDIDENDIQVEKRKIDKENAPRILSNYLSEVLEKGLKDLSENNYTIEEQLNFCNYLINKIKDETIENLDLVFLENLDNNDKLIKNTCIQIVLDYIVKNKDFDEENVFVQMLFNVTLFSNTKEGNE